MTAHVFEHWDGDVAPPFVRLHILYERHLLAHHRDGALLFEQSGDLAHLIAQARKGWLGAENGELQIQQQQIEAFGLFILRRPLRRKSCDLLRQLAERFARENQPRFRPGVLLYGPTPRADDEVVKVHGGDFLVQERRGNHTHVGDGLRLAEQFRTFPDSRDRPV
jgi:hypothetical protein